MKMKKDNMHEDSFLIKDKVISMIADCRVPISIKDNKNWEPGSELQQLEIPKFELET